MTINTKCLMLKNNNVPNAISSKNHETSIFVRLATGITKQNPQKINPTKEEQANPQCPILYGEIIISKKSIYLFIVLFIYFLSIAFSIVYLCVKPPH